MNANHSGAQCAGLSTDWNQGGGGRGGVDCGCGWAVWLQLPRLPADNKKITNNFKSNEKIAITPTKINNTHTHTHARKYI